MLKSASLAFFVLLWAQATCQDRGDIDVPDEIETDGLHRASPQGVDCSCGSKVAGAVILTIICMLVLVAVFWCFYKQKIKKSIGGKNDLESAAYDNPQFQTDELDSGIEPAGKENRATPCVKTAPSPAGGKGPSTKLSSIATNTTSTLERGKNTLERVMAAVISSGKNFSPKKTKDDTFISEPRIIAVPLQAHDFTGLGFTVHGNLRNGIYIKEIQNRGPAVESKQMAIGDKVAALTVFFDHMVYEDACKILSYALPYPILLHLEKNPNPCQIPLMLGTPPKGKKVPPSPSTKFIHPIFRSQSHSELLKLSPMELKKLRLGNIVPPKNKGISPLSLPKIPPDHFAQRDIVGRHSERAIDVPGVEIKTKIPSYEVTFDGKEKTGLTNVEVHRPMSPSVGIDIPEDNLNIKTCEEAPLTDIKDSISPVKISKNDSKLKFGVKVLPDLGFQKSANKEIDLEGGANVPTVSQQTTKIDIEGDIKIPDKDLDVKFPGYSMEVKEKSIKEPSIAVKIPEPEIEIICENEKEKDKSKSKGKFGFGFGHLDFKKHPKTETSDEDKTNEKNNAEKSNSGFGINIEAPSWKAPNFDFKFKNKDKDDTKKNEKKIDLEKGIHIEATKPNSPEISLEAELPEKPDKKHETVKPKDSFEFKFKKPEISFPSFHLKKEKDSESDKESESKSQDKQKVRRKSSSNDEDSPGFGISIKRPDIKLPSLDILHGKSKEEEQAETDDEKKDKKDKKKTKDKSGYKFNFKTPDFSLPSFGNKDGKHSEATAGAKSTNVSIEPLKVEVEEQDVRKDIDLNLEMPDFSSNIQEAKLKGGNKKVDLSMALPEIELKKEADLKVNLDANSKIELDTPSSNINMTDVVEAVNNMSIPDLNSEIDVELPKKDMTLILPEANLETKKDGEESDNEKSKWDLDFKLPSMSLPKFNLKKDNDKNTPELHSDKDKVEVELPSPEISSNISATSPEVDTKNNKKFKFGMKLPDVTLPSFGFDHDKDKQHSSETVKGKIQIDEKAVPDLSISNKSKRNQIDINDSDDEPPTISFSKPQWSNKETVVVNLNVGDNTRINFAKPDEITRSKVSDKKKESKIVTTESDGEEKETGDDSEASSKKSKKKKSFGFKIKTPDFEMPDFKLKHKQYSLDETDSNLSLRSQTKVNKDTPVEGKYTDANASGTTAKIESDDKVKIDNGKEDIKKKKGFGFNLKMPDITLPDFKFKSGEKNAEDLGDESPQHKTVSLDAKLPDPDLLVENENNENESKLKSTDEALKLQGAVSLPLPQPEEKTVPKLQSDDCKVENESKYSLNLNMPSVNLPNIDSSTKKDGMNNENLEGAIAIPSSDDALLTMREDSNATDATKKKRFGIKFNKPNIEAPHFSLNNGSTNSDLENQSDEMKSLHLRLKAPELSLNNSSSNTNNEFSLNTNFENDSDPTLSISDAMKTEVDLNLGLSDDDLQKKSDEWKIKEMTDNSKKLESTMIASGIARPQSDSANGAHSFKINLPDIKPLSHASDDSEHRTTKEIFGVKLRSAKVNNLPECDFKNEVDVDIQPEKKLSTTSIELSLPTIDKHDLSAIQAEATDSKIHNSKDIESDLPEADCDLKIKSNNLPEVDVSLPKMEILNVIEAPEVSVDTVNNLEAKIENTSFQQTNDLDLSSIDCKDLPEVDIDMSAEKFDLPKLSSGVTGGNIEYSINRNGKVEKENKEPRSMDYSSASDSEDEKPNKAGVDIDLKLKQNDENKATMAAKTRKDTDDDDKKSRGKLGLGFGFKGFGKSSDSEDNEPENRISNHPNNGENKDKKRFGGKMSFGIKNFTKSSSDTEEENTDVRVSDNPMEKEVEKSSKTRNLGFGFKSKTNRNSDSEDAGENDKVDEDPDTEVQSKKNKIKQASKIEEESKNKVKSFSFTSKSSKDSKSESEVGDDDKSPIEDQKNKHKYGLGFGFRRNSAKSASDSEGGECDEKKVSMDAKGTTEKSKDPKSKSLKLGFKGFKNLKGKIQTEINKMRHDSSDEEDVAMKTDESHIHGEKRKKVSKKKEKDKKPKYETASIDVSDEAALSSAAFAAKENRRRKLSHSSTSSASSASSSESSSEDDEQQIKEKSKKKNKVKRKTEPKLIPTGVMNIEVSNKEETMEVDEQILPSKREVQLTIPTFAGGEELQQHVPKETEEISSTFYSELKEEKGITSEEDGSPKRYVVVKEMKLKHSKPSIELTDVNEIIEKVTIEKNIPKPLLLEERVYTDTDGGSWGSDSDMERRHQNDVDVSLSEASINTDINEKQKVITDSEELKRRAASLGDLSRLHEGMGVGNLLERAASLDLNTANVGSSNLHVRRLRLPDSSATSIDEVDEASLALPSPKKLEPPSGLKAASRWGTLEDALLLERSGLDYDMDMDTTDERSSGEGAPISNIEISGGKGSSVTALSSGRGSWNESFDEETPPALPTSPIPHGTTTITVNDSSSNSSISDQNASDASIVIVPSEHSSNGIVNFVQTNDLTSTHLTSVDSKMSIPLNQESLNLNEINSRIQNDLESYNFSSVPGFQPPNEKESFIISDPDIQVQKSHDRDDSGGVTITMVPANDYNIMNITSVNHSIAPPVPPKPKGGKSFSSSSEVISYDCGVQTPVVTVNHDYIKENGDVFKDSDHNLSDEFMTPDSSPQKSMTQITLDGDGLSGYTVTEGTFSRTVIISNPDSSNPVSIVQTDGDTSLPLLQSRHE